MSSSLSAAAESRHDFEQDEEFQAAVKELAEIRAGLAGSGRVWSDPDFTPKNAIGAVAGGNEIQGIRDFRFNF